MKSISPLEPETDLTPAKILARPKFKHWSRAQAQLLVDTLVDFTEIVYQIFQQKKQAEHDNETEPRVITLHPKSKEESLKKAA